ncbi:FadR family transcriptional regulator [Corallococcus sp. CA054B]|uniref:FadR/GntR family transcriptional regulator n=1 Tax=Corallococcus sp. CA054B TaxID=2316734 RepID=UPI000EA3DAD1|nr:GntR family transcriptional regulator [Corallococcus sp. CA054B]RKG58411.1 FadR family transcriptional regulator [Corallococcus sp. CA054B]
MGMGRGGLVAYVEAQLERDIALGRLPPCGQFGSEAKLARHYDVCRGTIREAMRRLAARGLVVQRSGRKTRAVALDESLTLENLGLALHDVRSPNARWLLEGYFSLKRQVLVELLSDCCARASDLDLDRLRSTCFKLQDAARWESGATCAQAEFELLRLAARVASRPGHVLLVQSLQRAFLGGAAPLQPLMGGELLREWAWCAMGALSERNVLALQHELPALLKDCDERVLDAFAPSPKAPASPPPESHHAPEEPLGAPASATARHEAVEARPCVEEHGLGLLVPTPRDTEVLGVSPRPEERVSPVESDSGMLLIPALPERVPSEPNGTCAADVMGTVLCGLSDCRTGSGASCPEEGLQPKAPSASYRERPHVMNQPQEGGLLHVGRWASRLWRLIVHSLGLPAS